MPSLVLRDSVLDFMASNPTPWRAKALAAALGIDADRLSRELSQLSSEGKLVSCTVNVPGRQPQEEYRIAALLRKSKPHQFVIQKKTTARPR